MTAPLMTAVAPSIPSRPLLATLPRTDFNRIARTLTTVPLTLKEILHKPGERIRDVYFPAGGFCSILTVLKDGHMVEVATIGTHQRRPALL